MAHVYPHGGLEAEAVTSGKRCDELTKMARAWWHAFYASLHDWSPFKRLCLR